MTAPFFYSDAILAYDFGPKHPLKSERLRRTVELLSHYGVLPTDPGPQDPAVLHRVHDPDYVEMVWTLSEDPSRREIGEPYGFGSIDNPPFAGMFDAAMAYVAATARAAEVVRDGASLAFGIGGGLHHAHRRRASGFCIFDDPALACSILRDRFDRVAYVDIDVHHGDGVQGIFFDDPTVLTASIHEEGRTLFPGTGAVEERGAEFSAVNVPLQAKTTGDVWLEAFERGILPALERFDPQALVLQLGTDTHHLDRLGHIRSTQPYWIAAVRRLRDLGLPTVATGGGGYHMVTVPRMWASAVLELARIGYDDSLPAPFSEAWEWPTFSDPPFPEKGAGREHAEAVLARL